MTEQDKQLLLTDLCGRLPYGIFVNIEGFDYDFNGKLVQVYFGNINRCTVQVGSNISYSLEETKPWLRPMSSMTEDELEELLNTEDIDFDGKGELVRKAMTAYSEGNQLESNSLFSMQYAKVIDWLNEHHFDFRGLIEKGLAISTEEFNPY